MSRTRLTRYEVWGKSECLELLHQVQPSWCCSAIMAVLPLASRDDMGRGARVNAWSCFANLATAADGSLQLKVQMLAPAALAVSMSYSVTLPMSATTTLASTSDAGNCGLSHQQSSHIGVQSCMRNSLQRQRQPGRREQIPVHVGLDDYGQLRHF